MNLALSDDLAAVLASSAKPISLSGRISKAMAHTFEGSPQEAETLLTLLLEEFPPHRSAIFYGIHQLQHGDDPSQSLQAAWTPRQSSTNRAVIQALFAWPNRSSPHPGVDAVLRTGRPLEDSRPTMTLMALSRLVRSNLPSGS